MKVLVFADVQEDFCLGRPGTGSVAEPLCPGQNTKGAQLHSNLQVKAQNFVKGTAPEAYPCCGFYEK